MIREDLVINENIKIGALTVLYKNYKEGKTIWVCKCDCGNTIERNENSLKNAIRKGRFSTCGCMVRELNGNKRSIVGMDFTFFTVKSFNLDDFSYVCNNNGEDFILTAKQVNRRLFDLHNRLRVLNKKNEIVQQCKCENYEDYIRKSIRIHHILIMMKTRCYNISHDSYKHYGAKGIKVCDEWLQDSDSFVKWSLNNGYSEDLQIDRKDNSKDYCPDNCKWSSRIEQANNKCNNSFITFNNETKTLSNWCRELGLNYKRTHSRLKYQGWSVERAFNTNAMEDRD